MLRRTVLLAVALTALASVLVVSAQGSGSGSDRYIVVLKNAVDTSAVAKANVSAACPDGKEKSRGRVPNTRALTKAMKGRRLRKKLFSG